MHYVKHMKEILLFACVLLCAGTTAHASYNSGAYDPEFLPYNFEDAVDAEISCEDQLNAYDKAYSEVFDKITAVSNVPEQSVYQTQIETEQIYNELPILKIQYQAEFKNCIENEEDRLNEEAEEEAREEAREKEEERWKDINEALEECDFDFFDKMSVDEKMETYDERIACDNKKSQTPVTQVVAVQKPLDTVSPMPVSVVSPVVNTSVNTDTVPEERYSDYPVQVSEEVFVETDTDQKEPQEPKNVQAQAEEIQVSEEESSVVKKALTFLFGWLPWF